MACRREHPLRPHRGRVGSGATTPRGLLIASLESLSRDFVAGDPSACRQALDRRRPNGISAEACLSDRTRVGRTLSRSAQHNLASRNEGSRACRMARGVSWLEEVWAPSLSVVLVRYPLEPGFGSQMTSIRRRGPRSRRPLAPDGGSQTIAAMTALKPGQAPCVLRSTIAANGTRLRFRVSEMPASKSFRSRGSFAGIGR
jgi:hypothetical protein